MHGVFLRWKRRARAYVPGDIAIALPALPQTGAWCPAARMRSQH